MRTGASNAADSLQRGGDVGRAEIVRTGPRTAPARQKPMALGLVPVQTLLTVREAAELLRVRPVTVYRLCARGALLSSDGPVGWPRRMALALQPKHPKSARRG